MTRGRKRSRTDRWLPFVYWGAALLVGVLVLPSALRPPRDQPTTSGAFSPDAPPNQQQSLFSSFHSASSGTPGGGQLTQAKNSATPTTLPAPPSPPTTTVNNACPYGFGNPPRQTESVYSPGCAPAFTGSNGGATAKGVTANSVNYCVLQSTTDSSGTSTGTVYTPGYTPSPTETAVHRTYRVLAEYFNSRYQFYGRTINWYFQQNPSGESGNQQAVDEADAADKSFNCFAALDTNTTAGTFTELAHDQIFSYIYGQVPESYFDQYDPWLWSFTPAASQLIRMQVEYYCKKLAGKPPIYTNDPTFNYNAPRKVGIIYYDLPEYGNMGQQATQGLQQTCGITPSVVVNYDLAGGQASAQGFSTDITRLKAAGVTTIFYIGDLISAVPFSDTAESQAYFPEWFIGFGGVDTGHIARDYNSDEWKHAFGFSFYELPKPDEETECFKAYHEIDPNNDPDEGTCIYGWGDMVQQMGAIQQAGPHLTIQTVKQALIDEPHLMPSPPWHMAGGYGINDHTYPKYAAEMWYDPNAIGSDGQKGTYRFPSNGRRYSFGEWPSTDDGLFKSGIALAPTS